MCTQFYKKCINLHKISDRFISNSSRLLHHFVLTTIYFSKLKIDKI